MRLLNIKPRRGQEFALRALPFVATAAACLIFSALRLADNPADKLLPALGTMADSLRTLALHAGPRTGDYVFWLDRFSSLQRLVIALGLATLVALVAGVAMGLLPIMGALLNAFVAVVSMAPPLALLPILFITLGLGETSKIALILIGAAPVMIRDLTMRVAELPREQLLKAQTLGASTWQIALRVVLPQMLPRLIDTLRLQLGPAWLFLIASEAIASDSGPGYRIFLVRRYLSMDVILPYVAWITLLAFRSDVALRWLQARAFPWFAAARASCASSKLRTSGRRWATRSCWRISISRSRRAPSSCWWGRRAAARPRSCACCWAKPRPRAVASCRRASRSAPSRTRRAPWCSSVIRCSRI